jgi:hypothetical protein
MLKIINIGGERLLKIKHDNNSRTSAIYAIKFKTLHWAA